MTVQAKGKSPNQGVNRHFSRNMPNMEGSSASAQFDWLRAVSARAPGISTSVVIPALFFCLPFTNMTTALYHVLASCAANNAALRGSIRQCV